MKKSTEPRPAARRSGAFTLLEVLAAVAILGIWFAVLANVAIQGLRSEGVNERRIRASLIADRVLADVEIGFDLGEMPGENPDVQEEDEFTITVEQLPISSAEFGEVDEELMTLLTGDLASLAADVYTVAVRVTWTEGAGEESVHRNTYVWDSGPLREALGQQGLPQAGAEGEEPEPGEDQGLPEAPPPGQEEER
jgi:prepilin-type N-terminal cleavage/methylation domain-containing protein